MSEIERYLDELFDRLSGTGAAGRRALAEAEDHLRSTAADAVAAGLPDARAEHEAVARFGQAAMVARRLRSAQRGSVLNRALSAGWLLAGLAFCGLGVAYLAASWRLGWSASACTEILSNDCVPTGLPLAWDANGAVLAAAAGALLLLSRWLAVSRAGLAPIRRGSVTCVGLMIAMAALAVGVAGWAPTLRFGPLNLTLPQHPTYFVIATALLECLAATASVRGARRSGA